MAAPPDILAESTRVERIANDGALVWRSIYSVGRFDKAFIEMVQSAHQAQRDGLFGCVWGSAEPLKVRDV